MAILEIQKSYEKCAEAGWYGYDFILEKAVSPALIKYLGKLGNLIFLSSLANPFFKVETSDLIIKGVCNKNEIRVAIHNPTETERLEEVRFLINVFFL